MNEMASSPHWLAGCRRREKEGKEENAEFEAGDHGEEEKEEENNTQVGASGDVELAVSFELGACHHMRQLISTTEYKVQRALLRGLRPQPILCVKSMASRERRHAGTVCWFTPVRSDTLSILRDFGPPLVGPIVSQIR